MSEVTSKYIYPTSYGYKVDLRKSGLRFTNEFSIREHGSLEAAYQSAKDWVSRKHLSEFGLPLTSDQRYGSPRNQKVSCEVHGTKFKLVSGLYCENVNGRPAYFTVSRNGGKRRFSISKLGAVQAYEQAYLLATSKA